MFRSWIRWGAASLALMVAACGDPDVGQTHGELGAMDAGSDGGAWGMSAPPG